MILTKEVELKPTGKSIQYYKNLGYDAKCRKPLFVMVKDLPEHSDAIVEILCDYCNENIASMKYSSYMKGAKNIDKYACKHCRYEKIKEVAQKLYGVECIGSLPETKEKRDKTIREKYGVNSYSQTEESKAKVRKTCIDKYGVDNPSKVEFVSEKRKNTNMQKYGYEYNLQIPEVRERITQTLYNNSSQKTSVQQRYICSLYQGILNYPVSHYNVDIYIPEDNIIIEYDGGGHLLNVITGRETQEEFNRKEIIRNNIIKHKGYKQMRIISSRDLIPSDQILLRMLSEAKQYFTDYPFHSWCLYDIDQNMLFNAENKEGALYDFGELRKIKNDVEPKNVA